MNSSKFFVICHAPTRSGNRKCLKKLNPDIRWCNFPLQVYVVIPAAAALFLSSLYALLLLLLSSLSLYGLVCFHSRKYQAISIGKHLVHREVRGCWATRETDLENKSGIFGFFHVYVCARFGRREIRKLIREKRGRLSSWYSNHVRAEQGPCPVGSKFKHPRDVLLLREKQRRKWVFLIKTKLSDRRKIATIWLDPILD